MSPDLRPSQTCQRHAKGRGERMHVGLRGKGRRRYIQRTRAEAESGNLSCTVAKASCCQEDLPGATKNVAARCKVAAAFMELEILACQSL